MDNRYLYRAKMKNKNEWALGSLVHVTHQDKYYILRHTENEMFEALEECEVDPSTICQCTGLKDKNGKLIWENDIVSFLDMYSTENGYSERGCVGKVVWDDETISFQVTNRLSAESYEVLDECLVIGNIFDNPELLEVGE